MAKESDSQTTNVATDTVNAYARQFISSGNHEIERIVEHLCDVFPLVPSQRLWTAASLQLRLLGYSISVERYPTVRSAAELIRISKLASACSESILSRLRISYVPTMELTFELLAQSPDMSLELAERCIFLSHLALAKNGPPHRIYGFRGRDGKGKAGVHRRYHFSADGEARTNQPIERVTFDNPRFEENWCSAARNFGVSDSPYRWLELLDAVAQAGYDGIIFATPTEPMFIQLSVDKKRTPRESSRNPDARSDKNSEVQTRREISGGIVEATPLIICAAMLAYAGWGQPGHGYFELLKLAVIVTAAYGAITLYRRSRRLITISLALGVLGVYMFTAKLPQSEWIPIDIGGCAIFAIAAVLLTVAESKSATANR